MALTPQLCRAPGLHMMPGAHQKQVPSYYSIVPGRTFIQSLSFLDISKSACPARYWSAATSGCNVTGDVETVAAACNALPACTGRAPHPRLIPTRRSPLLSLLCAGAGQACPDAACPGSPPAIGSGWPRHSCCLQAHADVRARALVPRRFVYTAAAMHGAGLNTYGVLKSGQTDPYCLKPNPRTATYYRLNPSARPPPPPPPPGRSCRRMRAPAAQPLPASLRACSTAHARPCSLVAPSLIMLSWQGPGERRSVRRCCARADGTAYSAADDPPPSPDAAPALLTFETYPKRFPVLGVALGAAGLVALVAACALLCCWYRASRRAVAAERAAAKLEADSLERGLSGHSPLVKARLLLVFIITPF